MDRLVKERIMHLRSAGESYARIAEMLDISINSVKSFCRRKCLRSVPTELDVQKEITCCKQCGETLIHTPGKKRKRFCSDRCRMAWWKDNRGKAKQTAWHETICGFCNKSFHCYGNSHRKYCSHTCYIQARFGGPAHDN